MSFQIAIDGPAGAGKSTIAKKIADTLSFIYVDTGALYRALACFFLKRQTDIENKEELQKACDEADVEIDYRDGEQVVLLNGENVNPYLRSEEVSQMSSRSSKDPIVRSHLLSLQRNLAETCNVVMDGRDIGTVILPDAQVKIFLTASVETRAMRRYLEYQAKNVPCDLPSIEKQIRDRDYQDIHRDVSPLVPAEDAVSIDTSDLSIEEVTEKILSICRERFGN